MPSDALLTAFRLQAGAARYFGSELYGDLLDAVQEDLRRRGPAFRLTESFDGDPLKGFLPLRLMGAVHERVLAGEAPGLARFYPSVGGVPAWPGVWRAFLEVVEVQADALRPRLLRWPQTNEVRRCAALLAGFLTIASETALPLRLREIGASAGLNLNWHRYRYELGPHRWGDSASPVTIPVDWKGGAAPFEAPVVVESAAGCDLDPVRVTDDDAVRTLESYIWADQPDRLEQLRAAVGLARRHPPRLERASAGDWIEAELGEAPEGATRVMFHSAVWPYIDSEECERIEALFQRIGAAASASTPVAWLAHEHDPERPERIAVRLRLWPGGSLRRLADAHPHGRFVRWLAD